MIASAVAAASHGDTPSWSLETNTATVTSQTLAATTIGDDEAELTTYAERPVVSTEKVAKEKVRLVKDTVADDETVSGEVRKEQVDVDVDDDALQSRR